MHELRSVRGTNDLLSDEYKKFLYIQNVACDISKLYGFIQIDIPIFEFTDVYKRTLGDTSDVVSKEMYSFTDSSGREISLRPEFTAGISRAFISNSLHSKNIPLRYFSTGPLFRRERSQKGRYRQFHHINFELIGIGLPEVDVEIIMMAVDILNKLDVLKFTELEINSIADSESRKNYRKALVEYFSKYMNDLSDDSKIRLKVNPLRILDSKEKNDRELIKGAPLLKDYYTDDSKKFFDTVLNLLNKVNIKFKVNDLLVRGLDYYSHTVFEFITQELGAQGTVMAGGRYDGLISMMSNSKYDFPAIGFAGGIERIMMLLDKNLQQEFDEARAVVILPFDEVEKSTIMLLQQKLHEANIINISDYIGNLSKRITRASKLNAKYIIILGNDFIKNNIATIRDMDTGKQDDVEFEQITEYFINLKNI